jgi:hypothetical protein
MPCPVVHRTSPKEHPRRMDYFGLPLSVWLHSPTRDKLVASPYCTVIDSRDHQAWFVCDSAPMNMH